MSILIGIYPEWVWLVCWKVNHVLTCLNFEFAHFGSVVNSVLYCEYTGTITPIPSSFPKLMHDCFLYLCFFFRYKRAKSLLIKSQFVGMGCGSWLSSAVGGETGQVVQGAVLGEAVQNTYCTYQSLFMQKQQVSWWSLSIVQKINSRALVGTSQDI